MAKTTAKAKGVNKNFDGPVNRTTGKNTMQMAKVDTNAGMVIS
jgi:hypothetical protein